MGESVGLYTPKHRRDSQYSSFLHAFGAWWVLISDPDMHPQEKAFSKKIDVGFSESIKDWFESKSQFFLTQP